jgi:hypothetical protein
MALVSSTSVRSVLKVTGRIGFVDYHLDNYHADVYLRLLRGELEALGFAVTGCTALEAAPSQAWARDNDVPWFDDVATLDAHVDHYVILAPSNPETHLPLCEQVLPRGKSTYVDKTFAPDSPTAESIFALADRHGVVIQTSSAFRYTDVQKQVEEAGGMEHILHMVAWGGGSSFGEYAIHPVELVISCMGAGVRRLQRWSDEPRSRLLLEWADGRSAVIHVHTDGGTTPYAASLTTAAATQFVTVDSSAIFRDTARAFLQAFETGEANVPRAETLAVRRVLDAAGENRARYGFIEV